MDFLYPGKVYMIFSLQDVVSGQKGYPVSSPPSHNNPLSRRLI
jgi:hypothetical protein